MKNIERVNYQNRPLCDSANHKLETTADCSNHPLYSARLPKMMEWLKCQDCSHGFTKGYFDEAGMNEVAKKSNSNQLFAAQEVEQWRAITAKMVANVSNIRKSFSGRWMDIGFGNGSLLLSAQEFGYQVTGIDLRRASIKALKPYIDDLRYQDFLQITEFAEYDVISMADVLEHFPFPKVFLAQANKLIKPNGLLSISLPNTSAPLWTVLNEHNVNPYWAELEHFHNFSRERLITLLAEHGFEFCSYNISERYRVGMEIVARKTK